uniref:Thiol:disulfide interchange protein n=1 Tax=Antithamnion hubbsii TaxID=1005974 RepID=A0A4D6WLT4_9FLOR|nr:Thiol:disulfide interchange protein [Antithamnion hubbsii]
MPNLVNLYNFFQLFYYSCQQSIYFFISLQYSNLFFIKMINIVILGIFTSLTPCFFSLLPIMMSYISISYTSKSQIKSNTFLFGLISSFFVVICIVYLFNYQAYKLLLNIPFISFFIWILIALNLLQILDTSYLLSLLTFNNKIYLENIFMQNYITGLVFGLSSMSCSASIILTTIFWLSSSNNFIQSCLYLCLYLVGCILPFIVIFYFPLYIRKLDFIVKFWNKVMPISGVFILTSSLFSFLNSTFN